MSSVGWSRPVINHNHINFMKSIQCTAVMQPHAHCPRGSGGREGDSNLAVVVKHI